MKRIKDFLYDTNDILIAIIILLAAVTIIFWRLSIIVEYPKKFVYSADTTVEAAELVSSDSELTNIVDDAQTIDFKDIESTEVNDISDSTSLWDNGVLTKNVKVTVSGNSASEAIQCLIDAGIFQDYSEYQSICQEKGLNHEKVTAGTFTFQKGSTKEDVASQVNWG
jgi:hypothetical protein